MVTTMLRARGADVSSWQDEAATREVLDAGIQFAIVKISDGVTGNPNARAGWQLDLFRTHGVYVGVYHYLQPENGAAQWDNFEAHWRALGSPPDVVFAGDYEEKGVTDVHARAFLRRARQRNFKVGLYGSSEVARRQIGQDWTWAAWWSSSPPPYRWDVWQFSDKGPGGSDLNVFHGGVDELHRFWGRMAGPRPATRPAWWVHDDDTEAALGPFRAPARVAVAWLAHAARHPSSWHYRIARA